MAHFSPPLNRYKNRKYQGAEIATDNILEDAIFEDPIAKTVPIGWKGKSSSKREYATSTQYEEFWKAFSFGENDPEAAEEENSSPRMGHQPRDNKVDESESPNARLSGTATRDAEHLEQSERNLLSWISSLPHNVNTYNYFYSFPIIHRCSPNPPSPKRAAATTPNSICH